MNNPKVTIESHAVKTIINLSGGKNKEKKICVV